jgi:hypothetical protein
MRELGHASLPLLYELLRTLRHNVVKIILNFHIQKFHYIQHSKYLGLAKEPTVG